MVEKIVKDILTALVIAIVFLALAGVFSEYLMAISGY